MMVVFLVMLLNEILLHIHLLLKQDNIYLLNHKSNNYILFDDSLSIKAVDDKELSEALETKNLLLKTIDEMELSVRSHNCLQAAGIHQISDLVSKDESEMLKFKNFGRKSLTELNEKLGQLNLRFGMDISQYMKD